jgi:hypothetical protein
MSIRPNEFEFSWRYKYVTFEDGTVLFCDAASTSHSHKQLVDERPDLKPISAGQIRVRGKGWIISDYGSMTAHLSWKATDDAVIDKFLQPFGFHPNEELRYA